MNNKVFTYMLGLFFVVFIGSGIFLIISNKKPTVKEQTATINNTVPPTITMTRGFINLKSEVALYDQNTPINLGLIADSSGENVTAFDTVISYDPMSIDFVSADSSDPNFKVYTYKKDNRLTLTVAKTGLSAEPSVFKGGEIVKLVFTSRAKGDFIFEVLPQFGKETTKFVNEKTEVISPGVNKITVKVN